MQSVVFEGRSSDLNLKAQWLASEHLIGLGKVEVEILKVMMNREVEFDGGRKENVASVCFKPQAGLPSRMMKPDDGKPEFESVLPLILNATNRKTLASMFGTDTRKWAGNKIQIYAQGNIRKPDRTVGYGIRIINKQGKP